MMSVEVVDNYQDFAKLKPHWNALAEGQKNPVLRHEVFFHCAKSWYNEKDLRIVVCRKNGDVAAIAPLVVSRRGGGRVLEIIGTSCIYEPTDLLYCSGEPLRVVVDFAVKNGWALELARIPAGGLVASCMGQMSRAKCIAVERPAKGESIVRLREVKPVRIRTGDLSAAITSKARRNIVKRLEKIRGLGSVSFAFETACAGDQAHLLAEFVDIEDKSWKGKAGTSIARDHRMRVFLSGLSRDLADEGSVAYAFARFDGRAIAGMMVVRCFGVVFEFKTGYDEGYAEFAPGVLLHDYAIVSLYNEGKEDIFRFGGIVEMFNTIWSNDAYRYVNLFVLPYSFAGLGFLAQKAVHKFAKAVFSSRRLGRGANAPR